MNIFSMPALRRACKIEVYNKSADYASVVREFDCVCCFFVWFDHVLARNGPPKAHSEKKS